MGDESPANPRRRARFMVTMAVGLVLVAALFALGAWQVERRAWKHALIAAVDARLAAAPVAAPGPPGWPRLAADADVYRRLRVRGRFDDSRATRVDALTERGPGYWLLTPLVTDRGWTVLVNRGFVPAGVVAPVAGGGPATVTGLLRISEPGGRVLRPNDAAHDRWFSRDVGAIARRRGLADVAPYFIDAEAASKSGANPVGYPVGGMTVVRFPDNHLVYALTWFALAVMTTGGLVLVVRSERAHGLGVSRR